MLTGSDIVSQESSEEVAIPRSEPQGQEAAPEGEPEQSAPETAPETPEPSTQAETGQQQEGQLVETADQGNKQAQPEQATQPAQAPAPEAAPAGTESDRLNEAMENLTKQTLEHAGYNESFAPISEDQKKAILGLLQKTASSKKSSLGDSMTLEFDFTDGINTNDELSIAKQVLVDNFREMERGDQYAAGSYKKLASMIDQSLSENREVFSQYKNIWDVVREEELSKAGIEAQLLGPSWLEELKENLPDFDFGSLQDKQTWEEDGIQYQAFVSDSPSRNLARVKLDLIKPQDPNVHEFATRFIKVGGRYKGVRIFVRKK